VWLLLLGLSYYYPLFPPKKKSDAEKADIVRAELEQFVAEHGEMPSQHADLSSSRSLYWKLKKLKLLHLLKHDWRRDVCDDVLTFYDLHGRIPRRQNVQTDEQRAEDKLAQRWDRLLTQKASLSDALLDAYSRIFAATDREADDTHLAVCMAVSDFYETAQRLPRRQNGVTEELRREDALAQRWDRLLTQKALLSDTLLDAYSRILLQLTEKETILIWRCAWQSRISMKQLSGCRRGKMVCQRSCDKKMHWRGAGIGC